MWSKREFLPCGTTRVMLESTKSLPANEAFAEERAVRGVDGARLWLFVLAMLPAWAYAVFYLGSLWFSNADYSYGWLMPVLCGALFWERWQRRPEAGVPEALLGPVLLGGGMCLLVAGAALLVQMVPGWRLAAWMLGLGLTGMTFSALYLAGGRPWTRHFAFPFLFFLIAIPWPGRVEAPLVEGLSTLNATLSALVANILGSPAIREGITIRVGSGLVGVDEACSGIRSFQASVMIALFLGELFQFGVMRRIVFLVCGTGIAMACNIARTTFLVRTCDLHGVQALNVNHDAAGLAILGITLVALLVLAWVFNLRRGHRKPLAQDEWEDTEEPAGQASIAVRRGSWKRQLVMLFAAGLFILVGMEAAGRWWFRVPQPPPAGAGWVLNQEWLVQQADYTNTPVAGAVAAMLRCDVGRYVSWTDPKGRPYRMFYLEWNAAGSPFMAIASSHHARGHAVEDCLRPAGVMRAETEGRQVTQYNGRSFISEIQRFNDRGRPMHTLSLYTEVPDDFLRIPFQAKASTVTAAQRAIDSARHRDRGWAEKRVIKCAVWGIEEDKEAHETLEGLARTLIAPSVAKL